MSEKEEYICTECGHEMIVDGDEIICENCGNSMFIADYGYDDDDTYYGTYFEEESNRGECSNFPEEFPPISYDDDDDEEDEEED